MESQVLNLESLSQAIRSLRKALAAIGNTTWIDAQNEDVRELLNAGVVQNFEFTYELCLKMIRRRLELDADSRLSVDASGFRQVIRSAAESGLISQPESWFAHRNMRNTTSHTNVAAKAKEVVHQAPRFLEDAEELLKALKARNAS